MYQILMNYITLTKYKSLTRTHGSPSDLDHSLFGLYVTSAGKYRRKGFIHMSIVGIHMSQANEACSKVLSLQGASQGTSTMLTAATSRINHELGGGMGEKRGMAKYMTGSSNQALDLHVHIENPSFQAMPRMAYSIWTHSTATKLATLCLPTTPPVG